MPEPDGPRSAVSEPAATSRLTSSSATKSPKRLVMSVTADATDPVLSVEQVHHEDGGQGESARTTDALYADT